LTSINASGSSALTVVVGSEATKLTKFDASKMTADTKITLAAGDVAVSTGSGDDTFVFGTSLNNKDTVVGGTNTLSTTEDLLTATVTDRTATTGALTISGVERINLTNGGTAVIDATKITGATEIGLSNGGTSTTVSGLAAGSKLGLGFKGSDPTGNLTYGTVTVSLADETGTADSVTFNLNTVDTGNAGDVHTVTLKTTAIETVNLAYSTTATELSSFTVTSTDLKAATINITGSTADTGNTVILGTVSSTTTKVDGSTFKGVLNATAATGVATTFLTDGAQADSLTGSTGSDVFTIGSTAAITHTLDGGAGSDTLNITLGNGTTSVAEIDNFETINITVAASAAVNSTAAAAHFFNDTDADVINILGGNSLSTYNSGTDGIDHTGISKIDASTFAGKIDDITFDSNTLTSATSVIGGAGNDTVSATFTALTTNNALRLTNIDNLDVALAGGATTLDLANVTGLSTIKLGGAPTTGGTHTLSNLGTSTVVQIGNAVGTALGGAAAITIKADLASVTGTTDSVTFQLVDTNDQNSTDFVVLQADGVETINLVVGTGAESHRIKLVDTNATNKATVSLTGGVAGDGVEFASGGIVSDITRIDASTLLHNLVMADNSRTGSTAMTITGGAGNDVLIMKNANDVIDGGTGTDTLSIVQNAVLGGFLIDLSSTVDQITTYNGSANSAVQKGFENVNLSNVTGNFGADVTARSAGSTITGTTNGDVITLGAGVDTIVNNDSTMDTYNSFTKGAAGDVINISLAALEAAGGSGINAAASNFTKLNSAADGADVAAGASVIQELTLDGTGGTVNAGNADIFVMIARTLANTDAVETALEAGGDVALTVVAADDVNTQAFLVVYSDGTDAFLASARVTGANGDTDFEAGNLTVVNIAKLVGITSIATTDFNLANFTYVA
jgi:hypothetical protein